MATSISRGKLMVPGVFYQFMREFQLTLFETRAMESDGSVRKLKRNEQPLFRGESPGFIGLLFRQHVAKLTRTPRSIQSERRRFDCGFRFHSAILHGNDMPVTTQDDDLVTTPPS